VYVLASAEGASDTSSIAVIASSFDRLCPVDQFEGDVRVGDDRDDDERDQEDRSWIRT
jgi:hypothetical protein